MARWAKAAMCLSGLRVPLLAQTGFRPSFARAAVATMSTPRTACAPRPGSSSTRRSRTATSVFVSRVSLNPRLTHCFSWPERGGYFGSAGRLPFNLWPFALCLPVVRWKARHRPSSRKEIARFSPAATAAPTGQSRSAISRGRPQNKRWPAPAEPTGLASLRGPRPYRHGPTRTGERCGHCFARSSSARRDGAPVVQVVQGRRALEKKMQGKAHYAVRAFAGRNNQRVEPPPHFANVIVALQSFHGWRAFTRIPAA